MSISQVVIKSVPAMKVAGLRGTVPTPPDQHKALWAKLMAQLEQQHVTPSAPPLSVYYNQDGPSRPWDGGWDIETAAPVSGNLPASNGIQVHELPAVPTMASLTYKGPWTGIKGAYDALGQWIAENGYRVTGPTREINLRMAGIMDGKMDQNDPQTVTELQFPVQKA